MRLFSIFPLLWTFLSAFASDLPFDTPRALRQYNEINQKLGEWVDRRRKLWCQLCLDSCPRVELKIREHLVARKRGGEYIFDIVQELLRVSSFGYIARL
jgi:hypothetical protein